jgi:hypothetical protein
LAQIGEFPPEILAVKTGSTVIVLIAVFAVPHEPLVMTQ